MERHYPTERRLKDRVALLEKACEKSLTSLQTVVANRGFGLDARIHVGGLWENVVRLIEARELERGH